MSSNMKKLLLIGFLTLLGVAGSEGSIIIKIGTSGWGNSTTASTNGMFWGLVVNSTGATFSGAATTELSAALQGFVIPSVATPSNPVQIGTSDYYFVLAQTTTSASGPPTFTNGFMNTVNFNLSGPVGTGDAAGLLWFAEGTTTSGSHFGFQDLGQTVPADTANITTGWGGSPTLATTVVGVPEPTKAVLAAFGAFGLLARRRRFVK